MATTKDYYKMLGVKQTASEDEIKQAFRNVAKQYPDSGDPMVATLKEAYSILSDPLKRMEYDRYLEAHIQYEKRENHVAGVTSLQLWEYLTLSAATNYGTTKYYINGSMDPSLRNANFAAVINDFGAEGWDMVGITTAGKERTFIFKRPTKTPMRMMGKKPPA